MICVVCCSQFGSDRLLHFAFTIVSMANTVAIESENPLMVRFTLHLQDEVLRLLPLSTSDMALRCQVHVRPIANFQDRDVWIALRVTRIVRSQTIIEPGPELDLHFSVVSLIVSTPNHPRLRRAIARAFRRRVSANADSHGQDLVLNLNLYWSQSGIYLTVARICIESPSARELHSFFAALMGWDGRSRILQRHVSERHGYAVFHLSFWNRPCGRTQELVV